MKELSWYHVFKSDKAVLRDVTALFTVSETIQKTEVSSAYTNTEPDGAEFGRSTLVFR